MRDESDPMLSRVLRVSIRRDQAIRYDSGPPGGIRTPDLLIRSQSL